MRLTRSQFINVLLIGSAQRSVSIASAYRGVELGVQTISFQDRPLEAMLDAVAGTGIDTIELWAGHVEPVAKLGGREKLREWRLSVDLDEFRKIREMIERRRIRLSSYDVAIRSECTDAEIDRLFEMARALGVGVISSSSDVKIAPRLDEFARRHKIRVGFHNLSTLKSDQFARPDDYETALKGRSEYLGATLDVGHFTAAGFDPVAFLQTNHQHVFVLHLKDRKRDQGPAVPFGEGDTPLQGQSATTAGKSRFRSSANTARRMSQPR